MQKEPLRTRHDYGENKPAEPVVAKVADNIVIGEIVRRLEKNGTITLVCAKQGGKKMNKTAVAKQLLKLAELVSEGESPKLPADTSDEGLNKWYEEIRKEDLEKVNAEGYKDYKSQNTKMALLKEIDRLAKLAEAAPPTAVKKIDPTLNALVSRVYSVTGNDLSKMLTLLIMIMKKAGHQQDANKVYTLFQAILKKVGRNFEDIESEEE